VQYKYAYSDMILLSGSQEKHPAYNKMLLIKLRNLAEELVDDADERLFSKVRYCAHHVLEDLLPPKSDSQHNLRKRCHNITLPEKKGHLAAKNFIIRLLYKNVVVLRVVCTKW